MCLRDGWRNRRGALCAASARKALPRLASGLGLSLPPAQPGPPRRGCGPLVDGSRLALTEFCGSLSELGAVRLVLADTAALRQQCARLLMLAHPLGRGRAPGCRLLYLLESAAGPVGVLSFVSAPLRLGPRDAHLGWDGRTRGLHIERVVSNDRFLVLPGVRVPHLASHVLGRATARLDDGLGIAARRASGAGGDVRGVVAPGDELSGGGLVVCGPDVGSSARVGGCV